MLLYQLTIFVVLLAGVFFLQPKSTDLSSKLHIPLAFTLKTVFGIAFILVYSYYYGSGQLTEDAGDYMRESTILNGVFFENPIDYLRFLTGIDESQPLIQKYLLETKHWNMDQVLFLNESKNVIRVNSILQFISFNSPYIHVFFLALVGLAGHFQIFRTLQNRTLFSSNFNFWISFVLPSLLFWTSGILKEPFILLGLGFCFRACFDSSHSVSKKIKWISTGLFLLMAFKIYVALLIVYSFIGYLVIKRIQPVKPLIGLSFFVGISFTIFLICTPLQSAFITALTYKQFDFNNVARKGVHGKDANDNYYFISFEQSHQIEITDSLVIKEGIYAECYKGKTKTLNSIHLNPGKKLKVVYQSKGSSSYHEPRMINNSYLILLRNIPEALYLSLLTPPNHWNDGVFAWVSFSESILFILALLFFILQFQKRNKSNDIAVIILLMFALSLLLLIGWTTPVVGAIVRYRFPAQLAMLLAALLYAQPSMFKKYV